MSAGDTMLQRIREITAQNNAASAAAANAQMQFQAEMSNTAHQREVEDLIKAGLNPVLSANYGASTPNGAMAQTDMSGASAYSGYMGALANAGAIMYSADQQYKAQRDFPNTWAGLFSRIANGLGLQDLVGEAGKLLPWLSGKIVEGKVFDFHRLFRDAARNAGFINQNGNVSIKSLWNIVTGGGLTSNQLQMFANYLSTNWQRYFRNAYPGSGGGTSGGGFGHKS